MITTKHGSIFDSQAQILVCPVNCVGVMGKGLALEFKRRYMRECDRYFAECAQGRMRPGKTFIAGSIVFAATKDHWRHDSKLYWVDRCLSDISDAWHVGNFNSIAIPQLGCGCGGLDWTDVWPLYEKHLGSIDCDVDAWIYD